MSAKVRAGIARHHHHAARLRGPRAAIATSPSGCTARCRVVGATAPRHRGRPAEQRARRCRPRSRRAAPAAGSARDDQAAVASATLTPTRALPGRRTRAPRAGSTAAGPLLQGVQPASVHVRSGDLDAGEVLLAAAQHQPAAADQVVRARHQVGVLDPHVVEVGAALADGAPGLALALRQPGLDEQVDDAGQALVTVDPGRARLAQRGAEGGGAQRRRGRRRRTGRPRPP